MKGLSEDIFGNVDNNNNNNTNVLSNLAGGVMLSIELWAHAGVFFIFVFSLAKINRMNS